MFCLDFVIINKWQCIGIEKWQCERSYMKIIHCADLHLDSNMTSNLSKEKAKERKSELLMTFNKMVQFADENGVKAILIAGDLFDKKKVTKTALNTVKQAIVCNPHIEFYYLEGNHDVDSFVSCFEDIPPNLKLFSDTWTSYKLGHGMAHMDDVDNNKNILNDGKENISDKKSGGQPYGNRENSGLSDFVVTVSGVELNNKNSGAIYDSLVLNSDNFNIVMLHGQEAKYSNKDKTEIINISQLKNKGIDYLALGHIHSYKESVLDGRGVYCYSGCLEGRGFDECGEHGFVLIDIDEQTGKCTREFVPIAKRNIFTLLIDISGCNTTMDIVEKIDEELGKNTYPESSLMKFILVGEVDALCEMDMDYLSKEYEDRFYFLKIYNETKLYVDYNDFALDASLKGEFVRIVMGDEKLNGEEKADIIRLGIQALAGEEV